MSSDRRWRQRTTVPFLVLGGAILGVLVWPHLPDEVGLLPHDSRLFAATVDHAVVRGTDLTRLAESDPLGLLDLAIRRYNSGVRDYACLFTKTEFLPTGPLPRQQLEVLFKEAPFSVVMNFIKNPGSVQKVLYVKGANNGEAVIRPAGLLRVVAPVVTRPIHGPEALRSSRKTIDQFGLGNALLMLRQVTVQARDQGDLIQLKYLGPREVDGRKTFAFERRVVDDPDRYPDGNCIYHLDQEWLLPTAITCLAADGTLLGEYVYTKVKLNVGLTDRQFTRQANGL